MSSQAVMAGVIYGTLLGLFYFGGLWWTVRRVRKVRRSGRFLLLSFVGRSLAAMLCFWVVLQQGPVMFAAAVVSFFLLRTAITALLGRPEQRRMHANQS
ncbi:MAG: ATP synthase subunit I [Desulfobulbaceae bacterium]|nr:ATP synthase subunit I [Desulfobulbaceae bacterium]